MAICGRKPKPKELRLIDGTKGVSTMPGRETVIVSGDLDEAPDWLTDDQKEIWNYAIEYAPKGLLKTLDKSMLTTWAVACDLHRQASMAVAKSGLIIKSPDKGIPMQNPYLAIINRQAGIMQKAASEMGFSPTSRSRVTLGASENSGNKFAKNGTRV